MKKIAIATLVILVIGGAVAFYQFNRGVESLETVKPSFSYTADELFDYFEMDEVQAMAKLKGQVVEVSGIVSEVSHKEGATVVVLEALNADFGGVNCSFRGLREDIQASDRITVKGQCEGYLMDVIMTNCYAE